MIDDCEDDWANGSGWDYAHFRYMTPTLIDAEKVIRETFTSVPAADGGRGTCGVVAFF